MAMLRTRPRRLAYMYRRWRLYRPTPVQDFLAAPLRARSLVRRPLVARDKMLALFVAAIVVLGAAFVVLGTTGTAQQNGDALRLGDFAMAPDGPGDADRERGRADRRRSAADRERAGAGAERASARRDSARVERAAPAPQAVRAQRAAPARRAERPAASAPAAAPDPATNPAELASGVVERLGKTRRAARARLARAKTADGQAAAARQLAKAYGVAARRIERIGENELADLAAALRRGERAYAGLAVASANVDQKQFDAQRRAVMDAEEAVVREYAALR